METLHKIKIARMLYRSIHLLRKISGQSSDLVQCRRGGINWKLDLREGIDLSIYALGKFEPKTVRSISKMISAGDIVLDIGANIGAHALPMAKRVAPHGKVYAIEPTNWAFGRMLKNASLNPEFSAALIPIQALLTDQMDQNPTQLHSSWNLFESQDHAIHGGILKSTSDAKVITVDALVESLQLKKIDFIKIDVDGFECKVFRGASHTLSHYKPKMIMELAPYALEEQNDSLQNLLTILQTHGYQLKSEDGSAEIPMDANLIQQIPERGSLNVLALQKH